MTNLALAVGVTGETSVIEWDSTGPDEGYKQLLEQVRATTGTDWLDQFKFEDRAGDNMSRFMVWCADTAQSPTNAWATDRYGLTIGGTVVITKISGPNTVSLSWDEINFFTAEAEYATAEAVA